MYPLLICSLATWAIVAERLWSQRSYSQRSRDLFKAVREHLTAKNHDKAVEACIREDLLLSRVLETLLRRGKSDWDREDLASECNRGRISLGLEYKRFLWVLGTIGSACPFLGLFGTVVGILGAFQEIARTGDTGFAVVAAGISEALVATAAGIIVAVIAVAFYNFLQVRTARMSVDSKLLLEGFLDDWRRIRATK